MLYNIDLLEFQSLPFIEIIDSKIKKVSLNHAKENNIVVNDRSLKISIKEELLEELFIKTILISRLDGGSLTYFIEFDNVDFQIILEC